MYEPSDISTKDWIIATLIIIVIGFVLYWFYGLIYPDSQSQIVDYSREEVKERMEEHLYEKYGEEFVVSRIGQRSSRGNRFYQARIYPKSIQRTNKRWDDYYQGEASMEIGEDGLGGIADTYGEINRSLELEEFLTPKAKELFGDRIRFKIDQRYERKNSNGYFISYLTPDLEHVFEVMEEDPERHRLMLDLDLYIFDRIADDEEKEERREDIFEFVQYLQEEGLFEYLEMRVVFVDERVLADSYGEYESEVNSSRKVSKHIKEEDTTVELPPEELREEMSRELQTEVDEMSEEELLANMNEIRKDELNYNDLRKWNSQYQCLIYSGGMIKERYTSSYDEDEVRDFEKIDDVGLAPNLEYVYIK